MDDDVEKITNIARPKLEELARKHGASGVTQALPTMLELLPEGCSKVICGNVSIVCSLWMLQVVG